MHTNLPEKEDLVCFFEKRQRRESKNAYHLTLIATFSMIEYQINKSAKKKRSSKLLLRNKAYLYYLSFRLACEIHAKLFENLLIHTAKHNRRVYVKSLKIWQLL